MRQVSCVNYLKIIFNLQRNESGMVRPLSLSKRLEVSPPAVSDMLKKLAEEKYIEYKPYRGIKRKRSTNHIPSAGGEKKGGVSQVGVVGCSMAC